MQIGALQPPIEPGERFLDPGDAGQVPGVGHQRARRRAAGVDQVAGERGVAVGVVQRLGAESSPNARCVPLAKSWQAIEPVPWAPSWIRMCSWLSLTVVPVPGAGAVIVVKPAQNVVLESAPLLRLKARAPEPQDEKHSLPHRWNGVAGSCGSVGSCRRCPVAARWLRRSAMLARTSPMAVSEASSNRSVTNWRSAAVSDRGAASLSIAAPSSVSTRPKTGSIVLGHASAPLRPAHELRPGPPTGWISTTRARR